jgi:hypothetical protein
VFVFVAVCSDDVEQLVPYWHALWGQDAFPPVFALLFHKWLLARPLVWNHENADR